ncbi:MAG: filamentous hemagglutinin N-terminal domain-containing protein [Gammaproteobacteria bacterium]|nr:filamentous hemagglutinin N-terminal domain-containing protein [Gammaproteobacteria bacterium]
MHKILSACVVIQVLSMASAAHAAVVFDGTLGSDDALQGPNFAIKAGFGRQAGRNLFHSFAFFSLKQNESATFLGQGPIDNVISRVTGGSVSHIDGLLQSEIANVYFLNPAGFIFGPNASLNIPGSLHVSTADYLRLGETGRFDAVHPEQSRFTTASPSAFGFLRESPAAGINKKDSLLRVRSGKTISFIGGNLTLEDTQEARYEGLFAPEGQVNLISVASPGEVPVNPETLSNTAFARMGVIRITDNTAGADNFRKFRLIGNVDASGSGGGKVYIHGRQVILDNAYIFADTLGEENGQGVTIKAVDELQAMQARITTQAVRNNLFENTTGNGGDINISGKRITLEKGTQIISNCFAGTFGAAGNIQVSAEEKITISGRFSVEDEGRVKNYSSGILTNIANGQTGGQISVTAPTLILQSGVIRAETRGQGDAGAVSVQADRLILTDGGLIHAGSGKLHGEPGKGHGGKIKVNAQESVFISGKNEAGLSSGLLSNTFTEGEGGSIEVFTPVLEVKNGGTIQAGAKGAGKGGNLLLDTGTLHIHQGGFIITDTESSGQGGNIEIKAWEAVIVADKGSPKRDALSSSSSGAGDAGRIIISTPRLTLHHGGQINSATSDIGQGGTIIINAGDAIHISDAGSGLSTTASGAGKGGTIKLKAGNTIQLVGGGAVSSESTASGNAGEIIVDAGDAVHIADAGSGLSTDAPGTGKGGTITLSAGNLIQLAKGGLISSGSGESGNAGNIELNTDGSLEIAQGKINTQAKKAGGGNIGLRANGRIFIMNNLPRQTTVIYHNILI